MNMNRIKRNALLVAAAAAVAVPTPALAVNSVVAAGPDLFFHSPQVSADGQVAVMERVYLANSFAAEHRDVVVLDLGDPLDCGEDVLRELTRDGRSRDPSVSNDGSVLAYRYTDQNDDHWVRVSSTNGGALVLDRFDGTPTIGNLDISPNGQFVVYRRYDGPLAGIVRKQVDGGDIDRIVVRSSAVRLNDEHPIDDLGRVYYAQQIGAGFRIFRWDGPGATPVQLITTPGTSEENVSVDPFGVVFGFTSRDAAGVTNVFSHFDSNAHQLTFNTDASATFANLGVSRSSQWVTFSSDADLTGANPDRTPQVFRVRRDGALLEQVTSHTHRTAPFGVGNIVQGVSAAEEAGSAIGTLLYGHRTCLGSICNVSLGATDPFKVHYVAQTLGGITVNQAPGEPVVKPPIEVLGHGHPGLPPGLGCSLGPVAALCHVLVRNAPDGVDRTLLIAREAEFRDASGDTCLTTLPSFDVSLLGDPGQNILLTTSAAACQADAVSGVFRLFAVDPTPTAADRAWVEIPF